MLEYASKLRDLNDNLEREKHSRLADLRKKLAQERQRRKRELYRKHVKEAQQAGLDPEKVSACVNCNVINGTFTSKREKRRLVSVCYFSGNVTVTSLEVSGGF